MPGAKRDAAEVVSGPGIARRGCGESGAARGFGICSRPGGAGGNIALERGRRRARVGGGPGRCLPRSLERSAREDPGLQASPCPGRGGPLPQSDGERTRSGGGPCRGDAGALKRIARENSRKRPGPSQNSNEATPERDGERERCGCEPCQSDRGALDRCPRQHHRMHARPCPGRGGPSREGDGEGARLHDAPRPERCEPLAQEKRESVGARTEPGDAGRGGAVHRGEESDSGSRYEACHRARHAEEKQSEPPQDPHQRALREIQPMQDPLDHDAARVPLLGDLIMRKPALLLAELVGHSRHQVLRPRDSRPRRPQSGRAYRLHRSRLVLPLGRAILRRFPVETPLVSLRPKFLTQNHLLRSRNPPLKPRSRGRIAE